MSGWASIIMYEGQTVHSEKAQSLLCLLEFFFSVLKIKSNALHLETQMLYHRGTAHPFWIQGLAI